MSGRWRRASAAAQERAAARALGLDPGSGGQPDAELMAMEALTRRLEALPPEAWKSIPAPRPERHRRVTAARHWRPAVVTASAAACLAVGFGTGLSVSAGSAGPSGGVAGSLAARGPSVVLAPLGPAAGSERAVAVMPAPGQMVLRVADLSPSPPGTFYELWLMTDRSRLVPVAAFRVGDNRRAQLVLRLPDDPRRYTYLDISVQRVGAGTSHSGDSVLRGRLA